MPPLPPRASRRVLGSQGVCLPSPGRTSRSVSCNSGQYHRRIPVDTSSAPPASSTRRAQALLLDADRRYAAGTLRCGLLAESPRLAWREALLVLDVLHPAVHEPGQVGLLLLVDLDGAVVVEVDRDAVDE